ncbi:hypothetical protein ACTXT7_003265, partial [Hymenolepis weldensis]
MLEKMDLIMSDLSESRGRSSLKHQNQTCNITGHMETAPRGVRQATNTPCLTQGNSTVTKSAFSLVLQKNAIFDPPVWPCKLQTAIFPIFIHLSLLFRRRTPKLENGRTSREDAKTYCGELTKPVPISHSTQEPQAPASTMKDRK